MMMTSPIWAHARAREGASTSSQHPAAKTEAYGMLTTVANPAHTTRPNQHPHIPFTSLPASQPAYTHTHGARTFVQIQVIPPLHRRDVPEPAHASVSVHRRNK